MMDEASAVLLRWTKGLMIAVYVVFSLMLGLIVMRQQTIINRVSSVEKTIDERTQRFDRLEQVEAEQSKLLREVHDLKNK